MMRVEMLGDRTFPACATVNAADVIPVFLSVGTSVMCKSKGLLSPKNLLSRALWNTAQHSRSCLSARALKWSKDDVLPRFFVPRTPLSALLSHAAPKPSLLAAASLTCHRSSSSSFCTTAHCLLVLLSVQRSRPSAASPVMYSEYHMPAYFDLPSWNAVFKSGFISFLQFSPFSIQSIFGTTTRA